MSIYHMRTDGFRAVFASGGSCRIDFMEELRVQVMKETDDPVDVADSVTGIPADDGSFSEEEKREIIAQINSLVSSSTNKPVPRGLKSVPLKRGLLLPLLVNICAVLLVLTVWFVMQTRYSAVQERLDLSNAGISGAGEEIIRGIKAESESMLEAKEQELESARKNLTDIARQAETLRLTMDEQVRLREERLRNELDRELAEERAKLKEAGTSTSEIERKIRAIEAEKTAQAARDLDAYRKESEESLKKKEEELAEARRRAERITEMNSSDRSELERLADIREREKLVSDRINSFASSIRELVGKNDTAGASARVSEFRKYLENFSSQTGVLPSLAQRKEAELSFLDTVESLIAARSDAVSELQRVRAVAAAGESGEKAALEARIAGLSSEAENNRGTIEKLSGDLDELKAELRRAVDGKAELEKTYARTVGENARILARNNAEKKALETANAALAAEKKKLGSGIASLEDENDSFERRVADLSDKLARSEDSVRTMQKALAEGQKSMAALSGKASSLETRLRDAELKAYERSREDLEKLVLSFFRGERLIAGGGNAGEDAFLSDLARAVMSYVPVRTTDQPGSTPDMREDTLRLIGTVSGLNGNDLSVEPIGPVQVFKGDTMRVKRTTPSGLEVVIASGIVEESRSGFIRIRITETLQGSSPLVMDPVYRVVAK